jgi:hypothetical protein
MNYGIAQPAFERCLWNPGVTCCAGPGDDKPAKVQHANGEVQARRLPIAGSSDVLEEIAECLAMELECVRLLSRSRTGFRLQKIKLAARVPRLSLAIVNIVQYCTVLETKRLYLCRG